MSISPSDMDAAESLGLRFLFSDEEEANLSDMESLLYTERENDDTNRLLEVVTLAEEEPWREAAARMDDADQESGLPGYRRNSRSQEGKNRKFNRALFMRVLRANKKMRRAICIGLQTETSKVFYHNSDLTKLQLVTYDFGLPDEERGLSDEGLCHFARQVRFFSI